MDIKVTVKKVPAVVGMQSLVGVQKTYPVAHGNYFWLRQPAVRVLNFWAENLEAACEQFLTDGLVEITQWDTKVRGATHSCCIITDKRIPADWFYNDLCFTGFGWPPRDVAQAIFDIVGDPHNQMEWYTDPEMYHARRGERIDGPRIVRKLDEKAEDVVAELLAKRAATPNTAA